MCNQANAFADEGSAAIQLAQHNVSTWKTTCARTTCAANFLNGPIKTRFNGGDAGVNVVAIQTQASFKSQRVACT